MKLDPSTQQIDFKNRRALVTGAGKGKVMAVELGPHGIRVNSINPTVVMTEMGKRAWSDPSKGGPMLARIPLQRFAECNDIASVACFLLSDAAGMLNGLALRVDGGF
jgi:L-xylulose reductase